MLLPRWSDSILHHPTNLSEPPFLTGNMCVCVFCESVCPLTTSCSVISNLNLTILNSAVPNHIRPGFGGGPRADEKRHI